jgi:N-acetylglucosaminylphosphatidylinositol deacetylase
MSTYFLLPLIPLLFVTLWLCTAYIASSAFPGVHSLRNKRICLLIAHPDDEAMFFAPTVMALTAEGTGNHVKVLCLSSGTFGQFLQYCL